MDTKQYLKTKMAEGKDANQIITEIRKNLLEIQSEQEQEQKQKLKNVAAARTALIKAIDEYGYALYDRHLGAEGAKQTEDELIKFEECSNSMIDFLDWINL